MPHKGMTALMDGYQAVGCSAQDPSAGTKSDQLLIVCGVHTRLLHRALDLDVVLPCDLSKDLEIHGCGCRLGALMINQMQLQP